jgi:hypothetical protein
MCHYDHKNSQETQHSRKVSARGLPYPTHLFRLRTSSKGKQTKGISIPSALQVFDKGEEVWGTMQQALHFIALLSTELRLSTPSKSKEQEN